VCERFAVVALKWPKKTMNDDDTKSLEKLMPRAPRSLLSWSALNPFDHKPVDELQKNLLVDDVADTLGDDLESSIDLDEEEIDAPTSPSTGGKSGQLAVTLNFLNTIVGAGIVGLPYVFRIAGFYMVRAVFTFVFLNSHIHIQTLTSGYNSSMYRKFSYRLYSATFGENWNETRTM
jgi:hypothetical protein